MSKRVCMSCLLPVGDDGGCGCEIKKEDMKYTGLDEFREALEKAGWRIAPAVLRSEYNECNWYAWSVSRDDIAPYCACNDRPPSLIVNPHDRWIRATQLDSVEVEIVGETETGEWLNLKAFSIKSDEFFDKFPTIRSRLVAAWVAAASVGVTAG